MQPKQLSLTKPLKEYTLKVMSYVVLFLWIALPLWLLLKLWNKLTAPFTWIDDYEENITESYTPIDSDEGELSNNPYELDYEDNVSFQWDNDICGN